LVFNTTDEAKEQGKKIWIKNFLFYQEQLPLEKNNTDHKKIKIILEKNLAKFSDQEDMLYILEKVSTTVSKKMVKRFIKPTTEEIKVYAIEYSLKGNIPISNNWSEVFYNHYESNGWKVGKNPMKDWKATIRTWVDKDKNTLSKNLGKIDKIVSANEKVKDVKVD